MLRILAWVKRITALRIGLFTGLLFALLYAYQLASRTEIPVLTKMEAALEDVKFHQRGPVAHDGRIVVAAVDEASIARFGRFPWDRRVIAQLVDKLSAEGAQVVGFDMALSDQDLGAQFAGAKRFRSRFAEVSLAEGKGKVAVDHFSEAAADVAGAASALESLSHDIKPTGDPIYRTARGRLEDGKTKLGAAQSDFELLAKQDEGLAKELDAELLGQDPDHVLGASLAHAANVVIGFVALTAPEMSAFKEADIKEGVARISRSAIAAPELRYTSGTITRATSLEHSQLKTYAALAPPMSPIAAGAAGFGFFNALPDEDGVIRNTALAMQVGGRILPSLEVTLLALALDVKPERIVPVVTDETGLGIIDGIDFDGKLTVPTDARGLMRINYYGGDGTFTNYSVADIIDGRTPPGALKNKIVMVGATAQGTFDQRVTPFMRMTAGLETHCNALQTMLDRRFLRRDVFISAMEAIALLALGIFFSFIFARVQVKYSLLVVALSGVLLWFASFLLFRLGYDVFTALPMVEMGAIFILVTVFRFFTEERDKRQLRRAFQLYLNPEVMEEMLGQPEKLQLGGEEKEISVLFSDIRGFTSISEKLTPAKLVHLMNEYLTPMTDIVFARSGTLDKYIGDALMAFFGAPVHNPRNALEASEAALDMMSALARLKETWRIEQPDLPDIDIGIGINSGPMVVGNMGSSQRFNYTVMGDNVNLASRLEGLNKEYGTHVLISEATLTAARAAGGPDCLAVRELDFVAVKGKKEPVRLFELRGKGVSPAGDRALLDGFALGLAHYRERRFAEARTAFEQCLTQSAHDGPAKLFLERLEALAAHPPGEEWNGVFKMQHK